MASQTLNWTDPADLKQIFSLLLAFFVAPVVIGAHVFVVAMNSDAAVAHVFDSSTRTTVGGVMAYSFLYAFFCAGAVFYWRQLGFQDDIAALQSQLNAARREGGEAQRKLSSFQAKARQIVVPASVGCLLEKGVDIRAVSGNQPVASA